MALIRYPGSKAKLASKIFERFPEWVLLFLWSNVRQPEYREPFFGSGEIGFRILEALSPRCSVWINDKDPGIVALWETVKNEPRMLSERISRFVPSTDAFYKFKEEDGSYRGSTLQIGFRKLALHRMSYSGLGFMSGGPLGGKEQKSEYNVDCRWLPERMKNEVLRLHNLMKKFHDFRITCGDFEPLTETTNSDVFLYCDPPYYVKGGDLYKFSMTEEDHERLSKSLKQTSAHWVLSYDDCDYVRNLYRWAEIEEVYLTYTMARSKDKARPKNKEVLIYHHP